MKNKTDRQKIWVSMRIMKTFDVISLLMCSKIELPNPIKEASAVKYIDLLIRAGYIRQLNNGLYMLIKKSGILSPKIMRGKNSKDTALYDPNNNSYIQLKENKNLGNKNQDVVLKVISDMSNFTIENLLNKTNLSVNSLKTVIKRLIKQNIIEQIKLETKGRTRIAVYMWKKEAN